MPVANLLKNSNKGKLCYNRGPISQAFLEECSPPAKLSSFHDELVIEDLSDSHTERGKQKNSSENQCNLETSNKRPFELSPKPVLSPNFSPRFESTSTEHDVTRLSPTPIPKASIVVSPEFTRSTLAIKEYLTQLDNRSKSAYEDRRRLFEQTTERINQVAEKQLQKAEILENEKAIRLLEQTKRRLTEGSVVAEEQQRKLKEDHFKHAKKLEKQHEILQQEIRKKEEERLEKEIKAKKLISDMKVIVDRTDSLISHSGLKFPDAVMVAIETGKQKYIDSRQLVTGEISQSTLDELEENLKSLYKDHGQIKASIEELQKKRAAEEAQAKADALKQAAANQVSIDPGQPRTQSTPIPVTSAGGGRATAAGDRAAVPIGGATAAAGGATAAVGVSGTPSTSTQIKPKDNEIQCVDVQAFNQYDKLQKEIQDTEKAVQILSSTQQLKKLKFDLQKVINTNINAISAISGGHLREKLQRLLSLFSGQSVEVSNRRISINDHPQALQFCKYLLTKMIVKKGEEEVSAKHDAAFALGAVTVGMLSEYPDITPLLIGQFHARCPYTVPYHIPKQDGQSPEDYHKALGYKYDSNGQCERQDIFLKRMSGVMRLYAAIMISKTPRGEQQSFGIEHAWIWLSRVMNIHPLPDVTATMIYDMLQVTGHALYRVYKKQFLKLLVLFFKDYLPKLKQVASSGGGGPVSRLEALINDSIRNQGQIAPPDGQLANNFWFS